MRRLFRSALALFTMVLAMIGCSRPDSNQEPIDSPFQAAFRVPGMS